MKTRLIFLILTISLILTAPLSLAFAEDRSDRVSQETNYTFSPGYVNAAEDEIKLLKVNIPDMIRRTSSRAR